VTAGYAIRDAQPGGVKPAPHAAGKGDASTGGAQGTLIHYTRCTIPEMGEAAAAGGPCAGVRRRRAGPHMADMADLADLAGFGLTHPGEERTIIKACRLVVLGCVGQATGSVHQGLEQPGSPTGESARGLWCRSGVYSPRTCLIPAPPVAAAQRA